MDMSEHARKTMEIQARLRQAQRDAETRRVAKRLAAALDILQRRAPEEPR